MTMVAQQHASCRATTLANTSGHGMTKFSSPTHTPPPHTTDEGREMTADKRSVATDALETLGHCPIPDNSGRDAIHLAVEPVIAAELLLPGQRVGLLGNGRASSKAAKHVGIVDPFIEGPVGPGDRFWLVVYPRQITSLRHVWSHPDFAGDAAPDVPTDPADASRAWIDPTHHGLRNSYAELRERADQ